MISKENFIGATIAMTLISLTLILFFGFANEVPNNDVRVLGIIVSSGFGVLFSLLSIIGENSIPEELKNEKTN